MKEENPSLLSSIAGFVGIALFYFYVLPWIAKQATDNVVVDFPKAHKIESATPKLEDVAMDDFTAMMDGWDTKSPEEKRRLEPLVDKLLRAYLVYSLELSKPNWDKLDNQSQITMCNIWETMFIAVGWDARDASGFSLYAGPFMESASPQVTFKHAIIAYASTMSDRKQQESVAALNDMLNTALTGVQILQALNQQ